VFVVIQVTPPSQPLTFAVRQILPQLARHAPADKRGRQIAFQHPHAAHQPLHRAFDLIADDRKHDKILTAEHDAQERFELFPLARKAVASAVFSSSVG